jgi:predicted esterase
MPIAENFRRRGKFEEIAFIFPNAPVIPITVNGGMRMPGWYDIAGFDDLTQAHDQGGILRTRDYFNSLIKQEIEKGIPSERIMLGGFSQGGAISIFTGITCPDKLAGIFGLSSYLLMHGKIKEYIPADNPNKDTPIFMGHGDADPLVIYEWGQMTAQALKDMGWTVNFNTYKGLAHSAEPKEMDDLEAYIRERLPPLGGKASSAD